MSSPSCTLWPIRRTEKRSSIGRKGCGRRLLKKYSDRTKHGTNDTHAKHARETTVEGPPRRLYPRATATVQRPCLFVLEVFVVVVDLDGTRLWNVQEDISQSKGEVRVDSIYGEDSDLTLLTGLERLEKITMTGRATGIRLSRQTGYSSDPNTALAEWIVEMETFINANQGTGYTLTNNERSASKNVVIESFGWQRKPTEKYEASWDMTVHWATGMMADINTSPPAVSPSQSWSLDGIDLGNQVMVRHDKQQEIDPYPIAYADAGENETLAQSGAVRQITIRGSINKNRNTFDGNIQSLIGQDTIVTFSEAFPGRDLGVMIKEFESTREAGYTRVGEYSLTLIEGTA